MHPKVLTPNQKSLLGLLHRKFARDFYLAGGTAIALQIGHRRSIDFDLFTNHEIKRNAIKQAFDNGPFQIQKVIYSAYDQLHLIVNEVKLTFFAYPYQIEAPIAFQRKINLPCLLDLAAMKALALGGRGKWKDYVDLYFLLKDHFNIEAIEARARFIFKEYFNRKLFREQLAYFEDIDYSEAIDYVGQELSPETIKDFLTHVAISPIEGQDPRIKTKEKSTFKYS